MVRNDIKKFLNSIPKNVTVVAATKYIESKEMRELYDNGVFNFGENRVDSFLEKYEELKDLTISWHFIGHLQSNKAKNVINKIDVLHSLDSLNLAKIIEENRNKPLDTFIEISINEESNKNGVKLANISSFVSEILKYKNIHVVGLMMMTIKGSNHDELIKQFLMLKDVKNLIESKFKIKIPYLSMGMSEDYKEAIECGATHVRLGRILYKQ